MGNKGRVTGSDVTGSHVPGNDMTGSDRMRTRNRFPSFFLTIVVVQNVSLRMTRSSMATGFDVTEGVPLEGVGCAHAQPEVGDSPFRVF